MGQGKRQKAQTLLGAFPGLGVVSQLMPVYEADLDLGKDFGDGDYQGLGGKG